MGRELVDGGGGLVCVGQLTCRLPRSPCHGSLGISWVQIGSVRFGSVVGTASYFSYVTDVRGQVLRLS